MLLGAQGQLGREIIRQFQEKHVLVPYPRETLDITNYQALEQAVFITQPDVVLNAAAYTNVEKAEDDVDSAFRVNALGAQNLALACRKNQAKLVHVSTDYVFDGTKEVPYEEFDLPNPLSVYGRSKLWGEKLIQSVGGAYFIVRTSWLYGDGRNFVRTMLQLAAQKNKLTVVRDQYGTPTFTKDLVWVIAQLMETDFYGIYHASNQGSCSWFEFAQKIFEYTGQAVQVEAVSSEAFPVKATRPKHSVLENRLLRLRGLDIMRPWEEALQDYLGGTP